MPSYSCENCKERMTLQKASGDKMDCPTCGSKGCMKKHGGMGGGMVDESVFGF